MWKSRTLALAVAACATVLAAACDDTSEPDAGVSDAGGGMDATAPPTDGGGDVALCAALAEFVTRCSATGCDVTLRDDCEALVAHLDPSFAASARLCLAGDNPTNCFFEALQEVTPSAAQRAFGDAFCAGCRSDDTSCAAMFFDGGEAASAIARAVSDEAAAQLESRCASGVLCGDRVGECAAETLGMLGVPSAAATCFVDTLLAAEALPEGCGARADAGGGPGDAGVDAGGTDGGGVDAGGTDPDGGTTPAECLANEPNDTESAAVDLGDINDRSAFPAGNVTGGLDGAGDEDWFSYHDEDVTGGFLVPRADLVVRGSGDLDLCLFYACDAVGSSTITCEAGDPATSPGGLSGCCSTGPGTSESVRISPDCTTSDDSGTVYVQIAAPGSFATCEPYFLAWGDD